MDDSSLIRADIFSGLSEPAIEDLRAAAQEEQLARGEILIHQGETAHALYFIQAGRFKVVVDRSRTVAYIDAGEVVGELAFFAGGKRTADVIATRDSQVLRIDRGDYDKIANRYTEVPRLLLKLVSERLAQTTLRTDDLQHKVPRVIGVMSAATNPVPPQFIDRLATQMRRMLPEDRPVTIARQNQSATASRYADWLAEQEAQGGFILVDCDGDDEWTRLARRNVDALVLTANAAEKDLSPNRQAQQAYQLISCTNRRLVVMRERQDQPILPTADWLKHHEVGIHHHLALDSETDVARLARFLCGRAVGLILAGGGALGCAHLGVIMALVKARVPIDYYGGTSVGAAMAGAVATGECAEEVLNQMEEMFVEARALKRLSLPVHSLLNPSEFDYQLQSRYETRQIEDLPHRFFAVSTNLTTSDLHIHQRGSLWEAIRASGSLPTILPPFIDGQGNILVDGGVLDNVPVRIMESVKEGPNIIVALDALDSQWHSEAQYSDLRSPLALLRDLALRRKPEKRFPTIFETTQRAMVVTSRMASREIGGDNNILITAPRIPGMQILDWHLGRQLAELSEQHTLELIDSEKDLYQPLIDCY